MKYKELLSPQLAGLSLAQITRAPSPTATASKGDRFDKDLSNDEWLGYRKAQSVFNVCKSVPESSLFPHSHLPLSHRIADQKGSTAGNELALLYDQAANPFELALKFHVQGVNYQDCKAKSFTFYGKSPPRSSAPMNHLTWSPSSVLEAFKIWISHTSNRHRYDVLTDDLKLTAFVLTNKDPNSNLFQIVASAFRFSDSPEIFLPHVRDLMAQHRYQAACQVSQNVGLGKDELIFGFLMPLFFDRKDARLLYDYFDVCKGMVLPFIKAVDDLMVEKSDSPCQLMIR